MDSADFASNGSFGMMGLQERAVLFGGDIFVQSAPGQGTMVQLTMPRQKDPTLFAMRVVGTDEAQKSANGR